MNSALMKSAILVFLIILGYLMKRIGIFKLEDSKILSKIMMYVTLPAIMMNAFRDFTMDVSMIGFIFMGIAANAILLIAGWKLGAKEEPLVRAMYMLCVPGFNIGSFAIPFVQVLFPAQMMEVVLFDIGNTVMNCGINYSFAALQIDREHRFSLRFLMNKLLHTFPFIVYSFLFILNLLHVQLPEVFYEAADTVAGANALVVMLMLGIMFEIRLDARSRHQVVGIVVGRVATQLLMVLLIFLLLPFPMEQRVISALAVCAPISGVATIFCDKLNCDPNVYGTATSLTIPISVAVMIGLTLL